MISGGTLGHASTRAFSRAWKHRKKTRMAQRERAILKKTARRRERQAGKAGGQRLRRLCGSTDVV